MWEGQEALTVSVWVENQQIDPTIFSKGEINMSLFSQLGAWLAGIFKKARPGLAQFIAAHEADAVSILSNTLKEFEGIPINQWRDRAFADMSRAVNIAQTHPDTWVSLLVDLAYDIIKAQNPSV